MMSAYRKIWMMSCALGLGLSTLGCGASTRGSGDGSRGTGMDNVAGGTSGAGTAGNPNGDGDGGDAMGEGSGSAYQGPPLSPACKGRVKPGVAGSLPTFEQKTLTTQPGSSYLHPADLDGDGYSEFLLTMLSEGVDPLGGGTPPLAFGGAYVLRRQGSAAAGELGAWTTDVAFDRSERIGCPNSSELFDVDGDGVGDWVIGAGFLLKPQGKIVWMKGAAGGSFGPPQQIAVPDSTCWYHVALPLDIDGDKDNDFVTSCHVGDVNDPSSGPSRVEWFENDGKGRFESHRIGDGGGSLVSLYDLDADGDLDVIAPQFFGPESMVWYEQTGASGGTWAKHLINNTTGRGFIVKFADMNGDGKLDMLYGNHNNEEAADPKNKVMGIYWFEIPAASKVAKLPNWDEYKHTVFEGFSVDGTGNADSAGAPGMLNVGDIDGDCDMDVTASGDGDLGLYVFIQQDKGFEKVELYRDSSNANSGEQHLVDLDGDGDLDVVWAVFGPAGIGQILGLKSHVYGFLQD